MNRFFAIVCLTTATLGAAPQSATAPWGGVGGVLPNGFPWSNIGAPTQPMRWEMRIHNWTGDSTGFHTQFTIYGLWSNDPNKLYITQNVNGVDAVDLPPVACCTGRTDVLIRVQRDVVNQRYTMEVCDTVTGANCSASSGKITSMQRANWTGLNAAALGKEPVAFIRWYSSVVPFNGVNSGRIATPIPIVGTGDLASWEFEGNLKDSSGHGVNLSGAGAAYTPTPTYPPTCNTGQQQTFRAGFAGALDGSGSFALDGGNFLSYFWQITSGPAAAKLNSRTVAKPRVTNLVAGSYQFQLTVTDSSGQSSTCTINDGAVASDDNGVVITSNPAVDTTLGPLIRFGANPWPWFDNRHKADADLQSSAMDTYYSPFWDVQAEGTISLVKGSSSVKGVGTHFTTTLCQGPSQPTVAKDGAYLIPWYPTGKPGETGRTWLHVESCVSDTEAIANRYYATDGWRLDSVAGIAYAAGYNGSNPNNYWGGPGSPSPVNYYDNVAAYYALYYRSGIEDYLTEARKLADRFWTSPQVDRGMCHVVNTAVCWSSRGESLLGLTLRALDGRPDMWEGLVKIWDYYRGALTGRDANAIPGLWDVREVAYDLAFVSLCGIVDPDLTHRAACKADVSNMIAGYFTQQRQADGSYPQLEYLNYNNSWQTNTSVSLVNGSTAVVGNGTNWTASQFGVFYSNSQTTIQQPIWFINVPSKKPFSNADGDPVYYTPKFVDATHLTLDRPYQGATGTHGWILPYEEIGWAIQPFIEGILGTAFDLAAKALADTDPTNAALAQSYNVGIAKWIKAHGYNPDSKGMYYFSGSLDCTAPNFAPNCIAWTSPRTYDAEVMRSVATAYAASKDQDLKDFGDLLYNAMWAKPLTCPADSTLCVPDGSYISDMDDGGWDMTAVPTNGNKYLGMYFGLSNLSSWPAYRLGGVAPSTERKMYVDFKLNSVPGAVKVRVKSTMPSGAVTSTECATAPCEVKSGSEPGARLLSLDYLSAAGKVLASSDTPIWHVQ